MPDIVFSSVKEAVRWSEEVALMPSIQSSMRLLYSTGGDNKLSANEAVDIAQTITNITFNCKHPVTGMTIKAIMSKPVKDIDRTIGIFIAAKLMKKETKKTTDQLINLGIATVVTMREKELYGNRYPIRKSAAIVGVSRDTFSRGKDWVRLRGYAKDLLLEWIKQAEIEIFSELNKLGWIS